MKQYRILTDFNGSQTGLDFHQFTAGTEAMLSDRLAEVALREGWVESVENKLEDIVASVAGLDHAVPEGDLEADIANPAEIRETKVEAPAETKPARPFKRKAKA